MYLKKPYSQNVCIVPGSRNTTWLNDEIVACDAEEYKARCTSLYRLLRSNFSFVLGVAHLDEPLTHAQEMRLQCGGLKGLQFIVDGSKEVGDVVQLFDASQQKYGAIEQLPFQQIVLAAKTHYHYRR